MPLLSALSSQPEGLIRPYQSKLQSFVVFVDLNIVFWTMYLVLHFYQVPAESVYAWCSGLAIAVFLGFAESFQVYSLWRGASKRKEALKIIGAWFCTLCVLAVVGFVFDVTSSLSRVVLAWWALATPAIMIMVHLLKRKTLAFFRKHGRNTRSYAVVGATKLGVSLHQKLEKMDWLGYQCRGFYDDRDALENRRYIGAEVGETLGLEQLLADVKSNRVDLVYITLPLGAEKRIRWLLNELADSTATVFLVPDFTVFDPVRSRWNTVQGIPLVSVYDTPFGDVESLIKRVFDLVMSSLILLAITIPMAVIAFLIKRTSPGPILFKQKRYGIDGEEIEVWKFRSMSVMENDGTVQQATKNDSRITPFGAFLRRTSLDELPQFINVLQGRMSIIGPRPHAVAHNEHYRTKVRGYMLRHKVKPGITGLAQVKGARGETETDEKMQLRVKYDLQYINNWSLWLDIQIFFKTIFKGFGGKHVY